MSKKTKSDFIVNGEYLGRITKRPDVQNVFLLPTGTEVSKKIYTAYALACMLKKNVKCKIAYKVCVNVPYPCDPEQVLQRAVKKIVR